MYIYHQSKWPHFTWSNDDIIYQLSNVRSLQGKIVGTLNALGFELSEQVQLQTITDDVLMTSAIEGKILDTDEVRSSAARHLGMNIPGLVHSGRDVDGAVEMLLDATQNASTPLNLERLINWQSSLFPSGRSGMYSVTTGSFRDDSKGPMQVVSGPMGNERIHFEAPTAKNITKEMESFVYWFNTSDDMDQVLKAAIAHLWFLTIHPFDDGNGRAARALSDMLLARADGIPQRFYSMSAQIQKDRKEYYTMLEKSQKGTLNITQWIQWFLNCLHKALHYAESQLDTTMFKQQFWNTHVSTVMNSRQKLMLNRLLDGFTGKLTATKWAKICKCSHDTALRDINDLIAKGCLLKGDAGGRSSGYYLKK